MKSNELTLYTYQRNGNSYDTPNLGLACSRMQGETIKQTTTIGNKVEVVNLLIEDIK